MINRIEPTKSRSDRESYKSFLVYIVNNMENHLIDIIRRDFFPEIKDARFSRNMSYDSELLIKTLNTSITKDEMIVLSRLLRFQTLKGVKMAIRQLSGKRKIFRSDTGRFINEGTFETILNMNLSLVKSIKSKYIDRLKVFLSKFIGGGSVSYKVLIRNIQTIGDITRRQAEMIARTEIVRTISISQKEMLLENGITRWRWITALDEKVCPVCGPLNNKVNDIGKPFTSKDGNVVYYSPAHPYCRCGMEAVV